jgi:hypothetical protein
MDERQELAELRRLAELEARAGQSGRRWIPHNAQELGRDLREIPRQIGLTARYGLEAFGQTALPDILGLPSPQTADERVIGDASRLLVGAGGMAKGAQVVAKAASPVVAGIGEAMQANTAGQAAGAVGAGVAGGSVREAGGGPTEQFIAAVLGGVATPFAASAGIRTAKSAANAVRSVVAPKDIQAAVNVELQRAGIDWKALSADAQRKVVQDAAKAIQSGEPIDRAALARLADYRNIGAKPLVGDITQNPRDVTYQRNLSKTQANTPPVPGAPDLPAIENQNARTVLSTLENVEQSPLDAFGTGQRVQSTLTLKDAAMKAVEDALYRQARDSYGRAIPIDRQAFVDQAFDNLTNSNRGPWLPSQVREVLNTLSKGEGKFDVDTIDQLKTLLAQESRATTNGNVKAAVAAVRDALENVRPSSTRAPTGSTLPITGAQGARLAGVDQARDSVAGDTLGKFDAARQAARQRRTWQESAGFVSDALEGMDPVKYTQRHIVNAEYANLQKLRAELKNDPESVAAVRKQLVGYILERGKADSDTVKFTSAGMKAAFDQLGERKLRLFFNDRELQQIKSAINVARYSQSQPVGSAVNNSNSAAMIIGRMLGSILSAGQSAPILGPMVAQPLQRAVVSVQGASAARVPNALLMPSTPEPFPINPLIALPVLPPSNQ